MKALVLNNQVVDIQENEFEVHESMSWVECDNTVEVGYTYENGVFAAPTVGSTPYDLARRMNYPPIVEFVDAYYWSQNGDNSKMQEYLAKVTEIKNKYPKG